MAKETAHRERSTDLGVVRINNEAIMTIAAAAAMEVGGVHRLGGGIRRTHLGAGWFPILEIMDGMI